MAKYKGMASNKKIQGHFDPNDGKNRNENEIRLVAWVIEQLHFKVENLRVADINYDFLAKQKQ